MFLHGSTIAVNAIVERTGARTELVTHSGQLLTGSFMDYAMPRAAGVPALDAYHHEVPTTINPLGAKGWARPERSAPCRR